MESQAVDSCGLQFRCPRSVAAPSLKPLHTDLEKQDFHKLKIGNNAKALGDDWTIIGHSTILQKRNLLILLWATHFLGILAMKMSKMSKYWLIANKYK